MGDKKILRCPNCGASLYEDQASCDYCGTEFAIDFRDSLLAAQALEQLARIGKPIRPEQLMYGASIIRENYKNRGRT